MHEEVVRFIPGPVSEKLIALLRISKGSLWLIFNQISVSHITGEQTGYLKLLVTFIPAQYLHPSPPTLPWQL